MSNESEPDCKALENQIKGLEASQARLQKSLQHAAGADKQSLVQQIRELESEIREKQRDFNAKRCHAVTMKWTVAGERREALVFPPVTEGKHPLILAWHAHGGSMEGAAEQMHFQTAWHDAIVVYPQGLKTETGNDEEGEGAGWQKELDPPNRDLLFFDAMLATLREKYSVDGRRIYTAGFSNGTGFSYLLWVERGQALAAIGAVSGVMMESERDKPTPPRALISIAGTGKGTKPAGVTRTIERAREINHATEPGQPCAVPNGAPPLTTCTLYQSTRHTPIKQITHPLGHEYLPWAPGEIVEFFKHHERP